MFIDGSIVTTAQLADGDVFIVPGHPAPLMKCRLGFQAYFVPLFHTDAGSPMIPEAQSDISCGARLPVTFRCHARQFAESHNQVSASFARGCLLNSAGLWMRAGSYWLNLSSGTLQADPPETPWVTNQWVGICPLGKDEPIFNIGPIDK